MNMKLSGFMAVALLSISILSFGVTGAVLAESHNIPPISVKTDSETYTSGNTITVTGSIRDYDAKKHEGYGLTIRVIAPNGDFKGFAQPKPNSDGTFKATFTAGGVWKTSGEYIIEVNFNQQKGKTAIDYVVGEQKKEPPAPPPPAPVPPPPAPAPPPPAPAPIPEPPAPRCDSPGTQLVDGVCQAIKAPSEPPPGGCLIATAAYGTELAPQVQFLREIRDNTVLSTSSGASFMTGFNALYYSFAPTIADWERESPVFKEAVRAFITPMISTLSIMSLVQDGSELEVLGLGISVIILNLGMYIAAPALIGFKVHRHIKSRI